MSDAMVKAARQLLSGFLLLVGAAGLSKGDGWQCAPRPDSCDGHMEMLENKATIRMARSLAAPFMVDWNGDGLTDLLVGQGDGSIWYYQRAPQDRMLYYKNNTDKSNPFRVIKPIPIDEHGGQHPAGPVVVDWDMDGQLELILAVAGHLRYFKQHEGELVEQEGLKNPFHEISFSSIAPRICAADWDGDGDMDLILPKGRGLAYFEQVNGKLVERTGEANPFWHVKGAYIDNARGWDGTYGAPFAMDWDADGDLDLIYGQVDGTVLFFERLASAHLAQRNGIANPFGRIQVGHYAAVQAVDYNGDGLVDVLAGNQDGKVALFARVRDVRLQERKGTANPFYDIGPLRSAVPSTPLMDETGALYFMFQETNMGGRGIKKQIDLHHYMYFFDVIYFYLRILFWHLLIRMRILHFMFQETNVGRVELFKRLEDGSFQNLTQRRPPAAAASAIWLAAGKTQLLDWNGDGKTDRLTIYHNGTVDYKENVNGKLTDLGEKSPFFGLSFGSAFADANVSGYLPLDLYGDGRKELLVAEWGLKELRFFETAWCELPDACNSRGVCLKNTGLCSCMRGYSGTDCSECTQSFFTDFSDKLSDYPGFVCRACPGALEDDACSGRGVCEDDFSVKKAQAGSMSKLQLAFLHGEGTCSCSDYFNGSNCETGQCPPGTEYAEHSIVAHCELCKPGHYKFEEDNVALCRMCPQHHYAPEPGTKECKECLGSLFIYSVDKERTECRMDITASLPVLFGIICWSLTFYFAPMVFGLPIVVADISLGPYLPSEKRKEEGGPFVKQKNHGIC